MVRYISRFINIIINSNIIIGTKLSVFLLDASGPVHVTSVWYDVVERTAVT